MPTKAKKRSKPPKVTPVINAAKFKERFVLLSDLHAHPWAAFARGDGNKNSRLQHSVRVLRASLERARLLDCPWVFAGDLVHTAGFTFNAVMSSVIETLAQFDDVKKIAVWGNHDVRGIGGKIALDETVLLAPLRTLPNFVVLDPSVQVVYEDAATGLTFSGAGYQPSASLLEYGVEADVGVYHQTVRGSKTPEGFVLEEGIPAEELLARHRVSVVGHVHHWQIVPQQSDRLVLVPGSPEHHNFGDQGQHGWWVVTVPPKNEPVADFQLGGSPEFRTVDTPKEVKSDGNFYRVRTVEAGEVVPDGNYAVIAPTPTTIENRDGLKGAVGSETIEAWLRLTPPESDVSISTYAEIGHQLLTAFDVANLRPLHITQIQMRNFCSYASQELDVQAGTWLVVGKGRDYPSNGAGKSTLFESVYWLLFGRTTKELAGDDVIRRGEKSCTVFGRFEGPNGDWLEVTRTRGSSSKLSVETPTGSLEARSVNELTDKLLSYLGITPEIYQALGYFSQEKLILFAKATDGERKNMLADLAGLSVYQEAASRASAETSECKRVVVNARTVQSTLGAERDRELSDLDNVAKESAAWEVERTSRRAQAESMLMEFDRNYDALHDRLTAQNRDQLTTSTHTRRAQFDQELIELQQLVLTQRKTATKEDVDLASETYVKAAGASRTLQNRLVDLQECTRGLRTKIEQQSKQLSTGVCPCCNQPVTDAHRSLCLRPAQSELSEVVENFQMTQQNVGVAQQQEEEAHRQMEARKQEHSAAIMLASHKRRMTDVEKALRSIGEEMQSIEANAMSQSTNLLMKKRGDLEGKIMAVIAELNPNDRLQSRSQERAEGFRVKIDAQEAIVVATTQKMCVYEYWEHGFSKQGIQSMLLDEIAGLFNAARGSIFPSLTQGVYDVQFSTVSQTRAGEWRERTDFLVFENGVQVPYAALSGGQRRRVDVGVMLTLVKAVSMWMQVPGILGMLVLDEVFGFLDGSGAEGLMEALRDLREQIPAVFVISHEPQLQALFPDVIFVEQDEQGVSRIRS